jgi:Fic family protein
MFKHIEVMTQPSILKEAVASVRIEGTRTSFSDVVEHSTLSEDSEKDPERQEARNYSNALRSGFSGMEKLPLSSRLICDVHRALLRGVRGENKTPGQFRTGQVRIGGVSFKDAKYIPPPHTYIKELIGELEQYMNARDSEPELIRCALIHCQFEAIHPYWDGNGRVGRLLISLYLHDRGLLKYPILSLSQFFEAYKEDYYITLEEASTQGNWDGWVTFFLDAVDKQARTRFEALCRLSTLYETTIEQLRQKSASALDLKAVDIVFERLFVTAPIIQQCLSAHESDGISAPTSYNIIERLIKIGFLSEKLKNGKRSRPAKYHSPQLDEFWDSI